MTQSSQSFTIQGPQGDYLVTYTPNILNCADLWLRLEKTLVSSPYQSFGYSQAWFTAQDESVKACAFLISDADAKPLLFLPLSIEQKYGARIAGFIGHSHTNFGLPIYRDEQKIDAKSLQAIFDEIAALAAIDIFHLDKIPLSWLGAANPLVLLPHQKCCDRAFTHQLNTNVDETLRSMRSSSHLKQLRSKERKLGEAGHLEIGEVLHAGERAEALQTFLAQKSQWCAVNGIRDVFSEESTKLFMRGLLGKPAFFRIFTLRLNGTIRAVFLALQQKDEMCGWANSYNADETAQWSPGDLLLQYVISTAAKQGVKHFDLGTGDASYKMRWLHEEIPLVTVLFACSKKGKKQLYILKAMTKLKALIKRWPFLYKIVRRLAS